MSDFSMEEKNEKGFMKSLNRFTDEYRSLLFGASLGIGLTALIGLIVFFVLYAINQGLDAGEVSSTTLADGSVTTSKIASGAVTSAKLHDDLEIGDLEVGELTLGQPTYNKDTTDDETIAVLNNSAKVIVDTDNTLTDFIIVLDSTSNQHSFKLCNTLATAQSITLKRTTATNSTIYWTDPLTTTAAAAQVTFNLPANSCVEFVYTFVSNHARYIANIAQP